MSGINFNLTGPEMAEVVSAAILRSLDATQREQLIQASIRYLLTPPSNNYGSRKTPIQELFEQAIYKAALQVVTRELSESETVKAEIERLFADIAARVFGEKREAVIEAAVTAILRATEER